jgi:hypothetical protein
MATVSPNKIKYTPGPEPDTITVGGFKMGTSFEGAYSPTSVTDFWQGITPAVSGYTIYTNKVLQGPSIHTAVDDNELIFYANYFGGNVSTTEEALEYFATNPIKCVNINYPNIVTSGLTSLHDIGYVPSCPRKNITVYDLGQDAANATVDPYDDNNRPYTLTGSNGSGSFISFGSSFTDNHMDFTNTVTPASDITVCMLFRHSAAVNGYPLQIANTDYDLRILLAKDLSFGLYPFTGIGAETPGEFQYGQWVFVAASFTPNGSMKIYTDGFLRDEYTFTAILDSPSIYSTTIGRWATSPVFSDDGLDVMAVMTYPRVLTQDEVAQNFSAYVSRYQVSVNGTSINLPEINYTTDGIRMNLDASDPRSYLDQTVWADLAYPDIDSSDLFVMNNAPRFDWDSSDSGIYSSRTVYSTTVSSIASYNLPSFTVEVWVSVRSFAGTNPSIFCEIEGSSQSTFAIYVDPEDNMIKAYSYFSGTKQVLDSGVNYTTGSPWEQIVYTYDASTTTTSIYINSSLKNQQVVAGTLAPSPLGYQIGGSYNSSAAPGTEGTQTRLSVIRIYEKALSQQEITRNYNAVSPRF